MAARKRACAWVIWATFEYERMDITFSHVERLTSQRRFLAHSRHGAFVSDPIPVPSEEIMGMDDLNPDTIKQHGRNYWSVNQQSALEFGDLESAIAARLLCPEQAGVTYGILRIR